MQEIEEYIKNELKEKIGYGTFILPRYFDRPIKIGRDKCQEFCSQNFLIKEFFSVLIAIAKECVNSKNNRIKDILFSESTAGMDASFHKNLPECCWSPPVLYRTDQSLSGKIYEIQSPGSGWGDIPLLSNVYKTMGIDFEEKSLRFKNKYAENICYVTKKKQPKSYHMIDSSSAPAGMRYLLSETSQFIRYWGLDNNLLMSDMDYVTAHSPVALITSNHFKEYLSRAIEGKTVFGISPNLLFDQKAIYLLPFHRDTSSFFSDKIRSLFPYTSIIEKNGFYTSNGKFLNINDFVRMPKTRRRFYLKYGGSDLNRNWGSKSVYRLSGNDCKNLLEKACSLANKGEIWLIQEDSSKNIESDISDDVNNLLNERLNIKLSAFHGILGILGIKIMARKHFKVHGQNDTYVGIAE